jgi:hypothetical protein
MKSLLWAAPGALCRNLLPPAVAGWRIQENVLQDNKMAVELPHCLKCMHYFITHDPDRPYGCRAMAFKSRTSPARVVYGSSGIICQLYTPKKQAGKPGNIGSGSKKLA